MTHRLRAATLAAALAVACAPSALADECEIMVGNLKKLIDAVEPDKAANDPARCAAYGEGLGLMRVFRVVTDECLPEDKRIATLADLDRTVRRLQSEMDKKCQ